MLPSPDPRTRCHDGRRLRPAAHRPRPPRLGSSRRSEPPPQRSQPRGRSPSFAPNFSALGSGSWTLGPPCPPLSPVQPRASLWTRSEQPPPRVPPLAPVFLGRGSPRSGELPRVTSASLVLLFRLHLDIISKRRCPQDDHTGRSCAQDDAAGPGAELPAQRIPAGR